MSAGEKGENRCEYCLRLHDGRGYIRWCSATCAAHWMREFYWPAWHAVLARVLKTAEPGTDPREISAAVDEQTHWIAGRRPRTAASSATT
jgi:hypothetical protein